MPMNNHTKFKVGDHVASKDNTQFTYIVTAVSPRFVSLRVHSDRTYRGHEFHNIPRNILSHITPKPDANNSL